MKLEPHLPQLPSIGELLDHPRVKGLVERVNRSTLAQRAAGFLDELRGALAARTDAAEFPSIAHLAERLARRLLGESTPRGPVINATGLMLGHPDLAPPLAESCFHSMFQLAGEYHRQQAQSSRSSASRELGEALGGEAAVALSNFEAALTLAIAATAGGREFVLAGQDRQEGADAIDWGRIATRSGAVMRTMPAAASASGEVAAIVRATEADDLRCQLAELADMTGRRASLVDAAGVAGMIDPAVHGFQSVPTIADRLAAGADLVVVDGAGLVGGPACGLVIGSRKYVDMVANHPLAALASIDPLASIALEATLEHYHEAAAGPVLLQVPIWQQLSAPLDNLRQRAERLAPQMAASPAVASAAARQIDSPWRRWGERQWTAASWGIELRAANNVRALRAMLEHGAHSIAVREADDAVWLDLRTVFPRWDQQLVAALMPATASTQ